MHPSVYGSCIVITHDNGIEHLCAPGARGKQRSKHAGAAENARSRTCRDGSKKKCSLSGLVRRCIFGLG